MGRPLQLLWQYLLVLPEGLLVVYLGLEGARQPYHEELEGCHAQGHASHRQQVLLHPPFDRVHTALGVDLSHHVRQRLVLNLKRYKFSTIVVFEEWDLPFTFDNFNLIDRVIQSLFTTLMRGLTQVCLSIEFSYLG